MVNISRAPNTTYGRSVDSQPGNAKYGMDRVFDFEIAPLARDEKEFFKSMGLRIAQLRKNSSTTQKGLAGMMGVSQQTVAAWEVGRRGVPVSSLPALAWALGSTVPTLIGETTDPAKRAPAPKLLHQNRAHHAVAETETALRDGHARYRARSGGQSLA